MKPVLIILGSIVAALGAGGLYTYFRFFNSHPERKAGNAETYSAANTPVKLHSPLRGKTIIFLGSSVTFGFGKEGESFVEYLKAVDGVNAVKEAVSGTTLVDKVTYGRQSYITRLKTVDPSIQADAFICQLSTNDAAMKKPLGSISTSMEPDSFDTQTVTGAMEYVIAYAKKHWNCPVAFYTNSRYDSKEYDAMVKRLYELREKWGLAILDLWNDKDFNTLTEEKRALYMTDRIHPTRAGYRDWWLPEFEAFLTELTKECTTVSEVL